MHICKLFHLNNFLHLQLAVLVQDRTVALWAAVGPVPHENCASVAETEVPAPEDSNAGWGTGA